MKKYIRVNAVISLTYAVSLSDLTKLSTSMLRFLLDHLTDMAYMVLFAGNTV